MGIFGEIKEIRYKPFLCGDLRTCDIHYLDEVLNSSNNNVRMGSFILNIDEKNKLAISKWVSPKRTRSYPYARVYDTLGFSGKKVAIIPVIKDEGKDGDRDFLQWDTISLMSLLGVYVIISYYIDADRHVRNINKITNQKFDTKYIKEKIYELLSYHSDALHWNLDQAKQIKELTDLSIKYYKKISQKLGVEMHPFDSYRIEQFKEEIEEFINISRKLSIEAQKREVNTTQPNELLNTNNKKEKITIKNYIGGYYYFTCDEVKEEKNALYLIESKHGRQKFPSISDIKDGLLKMALYTNLDKVFYNGRELTPLPCLKLTTHNRNPQIPHYFEILKKEAKENKFCIITIPQIGEHA